MIKRFKKHISISLIITISFLFTGCWDYKDLNEKSIIITIGVDTDDDDIVFTGEVLKSNYRISTEQGNPKTEQGTYTYMGRGNSFEEARLDYDSKSSFNEFYGGLRSLVFSEKYARERGIETYLNRFNLSYNYRKSTSICITREPCNQLLSRKLINNISVGLDIDNTLRYLSDTGEGLYIQVGEIISKLEDKSIGYLIPYIGVESDTIVLLGYAVMENNKLIDIIPVKNAQGIVYLLGKKPKLQLAIHKPSDPSNRISYENELKNKKIKTYYKDNTPIIDIDINLVSNIKYQYIRKSISKEEIKNIESKIEEATKKQIEDIIEKSQKQYKEDFLGFGNYFRGQNYSIYKNIDWKKEYLKAKVNVNVKTKVLYTNLNDPNSEVKN